MRLVPFPGGCCRDIRPIPLAIHIFFLLFFDFVSIHPFNRLMGKIKFPMVLLKEMVMKKITLVFVFVAILISISCSHGGKTEIRIISYNTGVDYEYDMNILTGLVQNTGGNDALYVIITASVYNNQNIQISSGMDSSTIGLMRPGDKAEFKVHFIEDFKWQNIKRIEYEIIWQTDGAIMTDGFNGTINL
jgi:hypothetical protein